MIAALGVGIGAKLAGATAITNSVGTRIYHGQAPVEAPFPHVVFFLASGRTMNRTPVDEADTLWTVKAVAADAATAAALEAAIRAALHDAELAPSSPWQAWRCQHSAPIWYVENVDRRQIYHAGGNYRLRAAQP